MVRLHRELRVNRGYPLVAGWVPRKPRVHEWTQVPVGQDLETVNVQENTE
jgi:hypothetical protein